MLLFYPSRDGPTATMHSWHRKRTCVSSPSRTRTEGPMSWVKANGGTGTVLPLSKNAARTFLRRISACSLQACSLQLSGFHSLEQIVADNSSLVSP